MSLVNVVPKRTTNPTAAELDDVERQLQAGDAVVVQFDAPTYTDDSLARIDALAARFGRLLEVRFYSHVGTSFDCAVLERLPATANLSVDCLRSASNLEGLANLTRLERLSLGVEELEDDDILGYPNLRSLEELSLGETRTAKVELSFLSSFIRLKRLLISGQTRGIRALTKLSSLETLALNRIGKQTSLEFVSELTKLQHLSLLLGARASIAEIDLPELSELEVSRVLGLTDLGDMARFRGLTSLCVENQARIERIAFSPANAALHMIRVFHCKSLRELGGLEALPALEHLRVGTTALDREALLALRLPPKLEICALYTGKEREDERLRAALAERGYREYGASRPD